MMTEDRVALLPKGIPLSLKCRSCKREFEVLAEGMAYRASGLITGEPHRVTIEFATPQTCPECKNQL